jgi:Transglutaminase-like superfamily
MSRRLSKVLTKTIRLFFLAGCKWVSDPGEAFLMCRMAWWVSVLSLTARCLSLPRALEFVSGDESTPLVQRDADLPDRLARSIDLLLSANVFVFKPICWKRATVLRRYLSRNGFATRLRFGVRNDFNGSVSGHAWLESDGKPILEASPPEYVVTYTFPSEHSRDAQLEIPLHGSLENDTEKKRGAIISASRD